MLRTPFSHMEQGIYVIVNVFTYRIVHLYVGLAFLFQTNLIVTDIAPVPAKWSSGIRPACLQWVTAISTIINTVRIYHWPYATIKQPDSFVPFRSICPSINLLQMCCLSLNEALLTEYISLLKFLFNAHKGLRFDRYHFHVVVRYSDSWCSIHSGRRLYEMNVMSGKKSVISSMKQFSRWHRHIKTYTSCWSK